MSRVLHIHTDLARVCSPSETYAKMAEGVPADVMLAFGPGIWRELRQELRSLTAVAKWAVDLAIRLDRIVLLNVPDRDGSSHTLSVAPPGWSRERLLGYIAGRHEELEEVFGNIEKVA